MTTSLKTCVSCEIEQPLTEFYFHNGAGSYRINKCKKCRRVESRRYRKKNVGRIRAYDRQRGNRKSRQEQKTWRDKNPEKVKAHSALNLAVRKRVLARPAECQVCGLIARVHGHHEDYSKPLCVQWLCSPCHNARHKQINEITVISGNS